MLLLSAQYALSKARKTERTRLEGVLSRQTRRIQAAFVNFLATTRSNTTMREVRQLLEKNDITGATKIVEQHIVALGRVIPQAFTDAAGQEATALATRLGRRSSVAITFDPSNDRAARIMRSSQLQFVQGVTNHQRDAIRTALAEAYRDGDSVQNATRAFRDSIGLTQYQVQTVDNYRNLLESGSKSALERELRDRRFDRSVERMLTDGDPLDESQIDRMVERYRLNLLAYHAENIGLTEGLGVVSQARQEAMSQVVEQVGFDPSEIRRTWRSTKDHRTRDSHAAMDGQTVGLNEPFITPDGDELMYPGDPNAPAKERIHCRCTVTTEFL